MEGIKTEKHYVPDASAILAILLPDELHLPTSIKIVSLIDNVNNKFLAPHLLKYEVANGLRSALIQARIGKRVFNKLVKSFIVLPIAYRDVDLVKVSKISTENNLTVYDASYLYLSEVESAVLIAIDKDLKPFSSI